MSCSPWPTRESASTASTWPTSSPASSAAPTRAGCQVPGAGLGLDIVRTIVEAHGGEVSLDSAPGAGTTVRVALPR